MSRRGLGIYCIVVTLLMTSGAPSFAAPAAVTSADRATALVINPVPIPIGIVPPKIWNGTQLKAWLDGLGNTLFATTYPGLVLLQSPNQANVAYNGWTATALAPFTLTPTVVDKIELIPGYVDPATSTVFDLEVAWVQGKLATNLGTVSTGMLSVTATYVANPAWKIALVQPLGADYPYGANLRTAASAAADVDAAITVDPTQKGILDLTELLSGSAYQAAAGDPCDGCKKTYNRDIDRMKEDLKSCLKWAVAGGVVGGLLGLLGGNPWTVFGGAALGAELVAAQCADTAATAAKRALEDFCECLAENECPPNPLCNPT